MTNEYENLNNIKFTINVELKKVRRTKGSPFKNSKFHYKFWVFINGNVLRTQGILGANSVNELKKKIVLDLLPIYKGRGYPKEISGFIPPPHG